MAAVIKYTKKNLIPGEQILYAASLHNFCYVFPIVLLLLGIGFAAMPLFKGGSGETPQAEHAQAARGEIEQQYDSLKDSAGYYAGFITQYLPPEMVEFLKTANEVRMLLIGMLLLLIGLVSLLSVILKKVSTEQVITNKKIIQKKGFIMVDENEIALSNIEGVKVYQTVLDRILGRGTVQVNGMGMEQIEVKDITDPNRFRHNAYTAMEKNGPHRGH